MRWTKTKIQKFFLGVGLILLVVGMYNPLQNETDNGTHLDSNGDSNSPRTSYTFEVSNPQILPQGNNPIRFHISAYTETEWYEPFLVYITQIYYQINSMPRILCWDGLDTDVSFTGFVDSEMWLNTPPGTNYLYVWVYNDRDDERQVWSPFGKTVPTPEVTINDPQPWQLCNETAPSFSLSTSAYATIDTIWYSLDSGVTTTLCGLTGDFSEQWGNKPNGTVTATFTVQDHWGQLGSTSITVHKVVIAPVITSTGLAPFQLCGFAAPMFSLTIENGGNVAATWYSLDNGLTNTTCDVIGDLAAQWGAQENGTVLVTFWVSDVWGTTTSTAITIQKYILIPVIIDTGLVPHQIFGPIAPSFALTIYGDAFLASTWYSLNNGITNTTCNLIGDLAGQWALYPNGPVTVTFWASDIFGNNTSTCVTLQKQVIASGILVNGADMACGFGSERYGVSLGIYVPGNDIWNVSVAIEEMQDLNGDGSIHGRYSDIASIVVEGYASVNLVLSILYCEEGRVGDGQSGIFYRYHIWAEDQEGYTVVDHYVNKVGLYHWSNWEGGNVTWDAISQYNEGGYSVYIKSAFWNQTTGLLYDNIDVNGTVIVTSTDIGQQPAAGEIAPALPSIGTMSTTGIQMSVFMSLYASGWYYFTYIAPTDASDPWAERLGCPPIPS